MIKRIRLKNFQSWKALDMALGPITMLVGRGNGGKTAIYRAITAALQNNGGDEGIRHGATKAQVLLDMDDGKSLLWTKGRGTGAVYHVEDGEDVQEHTKTGQTTPEEIVNQFGFRPVELDKNLSIWPQFKDQWDKPFIVFESGSRVAKVLGKLTKLDVFVRAQMNARRAIDAAQAEARTAQDEAERRREDLEAMPDLVALRRDYDRITARHQRILASQAKTAEARETLQAHREAERILATHAATEQAYQTVQAASETLAEAVAYRGHLLELRQHVSAVRTAETALTAAIGGFNELAIEYEGACQEKGVCATCPYK